MTASHTCAGCGRKSGVEELRRDLYIGQRTIGDFQALRNHGRRVLRVQVQDVAQGLVKIGQAIGATAGVA